PAPGRDLTERLAAYVGEPDVELGHLAGDDVEVARAEGQRAFAGAAAADGPAVQAGDRRDLGGGADQEELVGHVELVARGHGGLDGKAHGLRDLDDAVAGYAAQVDGVGYGVEHVAHEEEDVLARA